MKHVIEAGTDAASLLLFDPGALPEDFDTRMQKDPGGVLNELTRTGKAYWIHTGRDGRFLLHVYVDEPVPLSLLQYSHDPIAVEHFPVPTGKLYFTGAECSARDEATFLRKHSHMGGCCTVPAGVYLLTLFRMAYPGGLQEQLLKEQVSPTVYRLFRSMACLAPIAVVAVISLVVSFFFMSRTLWLQYPLPVASVLVALPIFVSRLRKYRQARELYKRIEWECPSVVARLEFREGG